MRLIAPILLSALVALAVACSGDDDTPAATATTGSLPTLQAPTQPPAGETPSPTAAAPMPTTAPGSTTPPTDGTVFPQNPGATDPYPLKPNPDPATGIFTLTDVRVGAHPESGGWDRIVFEFEDVQGSPGAHPGGHIEYVDEAFHCGSGNEIEELDGEAILHVRLDMTQAHNEAGQVTVDALEIEGPGNSILEARSICDFEGIVEWVVGVPAEQNFKVVWLDGPSRLVIDIKWP